jgi:RNA polymerase sigma-70 factor, ECF subfamily
MIFSENRLPLFRIMLVAAAFTHISCVAPPACPGAPEKPDLRPNRRTRREKFLLFRLNLVARRLSHPGARSDLPMDETSDEVLIAKIAKGDRLAMAALFARYRVRVFRFVARMMRNDAVAEELGSDVFLEIWRQAGTFEGRAAVSTWIFSIARFKALNALARRPEAELDEEKAEAIEDDADDPEVALAKKDKAAALWACLQKLSAEHREIVTLVYYQQKSVEECARIIGIPEATVKTRMFYARKKLSELLREQGIERGWP